MDPKKLLEEFSKLKGEADAVVALAHKENRELTKEEKEANDKRFSRMSQIKSVLEEHNRFASMGIATFQVGGGNDTGNGGGGAGGGGGGGGNLQLPTDPPGREQFDKANKDPDHLFTARPGEDADKARIRIHHNAVNNFIRSGVEPAGLKFTLTTGSGAGILLPTRINTPIVIKRVRNSIRAAIQARGLRVIETDGMENISVPVFDDSANTADVIAQDNTSENNKDPALSGLSLGADLYDSGTVWSSNTLLNSLTFDLLAYLEPMLDARIAAKELALWVADLIANAVVGKTTASVNGVTYDELLDWQHSVPVTRRMDGVFLISDGLLRALRGLKDTTGRPIFQESLRDDAPDTLLGWPVFVTEGLATPAAAAVSGIAASAEALVVRDVRNRRIARYTNIPTHPDQFGIRMFSNGDFAFHSAGVRALKHAAA